MFFIINNQLNCRWCLVKKRQLKKIHTQSVSSFYPTTKGKIYNLLLSFSMDDDQRKMTVQKNKRLKWWWWQKWIEVSSSTLDDYHLSSCWIKMTSKSTSLQTNVGKCWNSKATNQTYHRTVKETNRKTIKMLKRHGKSSSSKLDRWRRIDKMWIDEEIEGEEEWKERAKCKERRNIKRWYK